jgi:hypothetical protein
MLTFPIIISCEKANNTIHQINQIKNTNLILKEAEIIEVKTYKGSLLGADLNRNEIYILASPTEEDKYNVEIIDMGQGKAINILKLRKEGFQSPTDVYNPSYMQFLNNRYYLIDQFHKVLVFDQDLAYLQTIMLKGAQPRYFIDFFSRGGDVFFGIGEKHFGLKESKCSIEIYRIIEKTKLELYKNIYETSHRSNNYTRQTRNIINGVLWSSSWGFEKLGKIYFGNGAENQYFVYDLNSNNLESIKINFLKGNKFSDKDANKIVNDIYKAGGTYEEIRKRHNLIFKFISYPGIIYYFGFYDVGENKLGFAGDIDLKRMFFRLDIINIDSKDYKESIWLPIGHSFLRMLDENYTGLFQNEINIDKGIFVYTDREEENDESIVKLVRFRNN